MSTDFHGKAVLITGGGTGIGRAACEAFLAAGASVMVCGRRQAPLEETCAAHERAAWTLCDVAAPGAAKAAVEATLERFGRLDVVVNNAGVFVFKPLTETSDDELATILDVNVRGLLSISREAIPALVASKGAIVNVSSVIAQGVLPGSIAYAGSKAAVEQITRCLAMELGATGVRVNCVAPGLTATDMAASITDNPDAAADTIRRTPLGRLGTPEEIARTILFLAADGWVTGQVVQSSGGLLL